MEPILTKQTARKSTGGKAPHFKLVTAESGGSSVQASVQASVEASVASSSVIDDMDIDAILAADPDEDLPHWSDHIHGLIDEILNGMWFCFIHNFSCCTLFIACGFGLWNWHVVYIYDGDLLAMMVICC